MFRKVMGAGFALLAAIASCGAASDYPNRPITLVAPYAAGGPTDVTARVLAAYLSKMLDQNVIVENRPGAGTAIGIDHVVKSEPDGYTLLWASSDGLSVLPALRKTPYNVATDLTFIASPVKYSGPFVAVNSKRPFKTMADLIAYAKQNPNTLTYSSAGFGSGVHLSTALIAKNAGIQLVHVPYQGAAPAVQAASNGVVDMILVGKAGLKPYTDNGTLRPLAVASEHRDPAYPDVPTLSEAGLSNVNVDLYVGLLAPAKTPDPVVQRLRAALTGFSKDKQSIKRLIGAGAETTYLDSTAFKSYMLKDNERWKEVVRATGITLPQ